MSATSLAARGASFARRNKGRLAPALAREVAARVMTRPALRRMARAAVPPREPDRWAFVVGCYGSGTTLLREMLGAHPDIAALPREGVVLTDAFPDLEAHGWTRMMHAARWTPPGPGAAARAKADWALLWKAGARVFLEKSIAHSVRLAWLEAAFGAPRVIVLRRDPHAVCEGIARRARPAGAAARAVGTAYPMEMIAAQWRAIDDAIRADLPSLTHVHETSYEALMADPARELRACLTFLGVDASRVTGHSGGVAVAGRPFDLRDANPAAHARLDDAGHSAISAILDG